MGLHGTRSALSGCCGPELGRGLYDNLTRYIRFEMGCMFGFIISFLGASIFNVADGEPLLPPQILRVAFTTVTIQSIGLGYSKPPAGLMERTLTIARTMGVVTFSLLNLFFSIEAKDERQSAFFLDTFSDRTFIITTGVSFFLLVMSTVLRPFQAILKTTTLDVRQWLLCTAVALSIIAAAETRKAVRRAGRP